MRAQVTAWSERRSQAGASVVIIGVPPPVRAVLRCGGLHTADHTDTHGYAPLIWRLDGVGAGCSVPKCHRVGEHRAASPVCASRGTVCTVRMSRTVAAAGTNWIAPGLSSTVWTDGCSARSLWGRPARCASSRPGLGGAGIRRRPRTPGLVARAHHRCAAQRHRMSPASTYTCRISRVSSRHPSTELLPPRSDEYGFWASRRAGPTARTGITPATIRPPSHSRLRVKVNTRSPPCCRLVQQNT